MGPLTDEEGNRDEEEEKVRYEKGLQLVLEQFEVCDKVILSDESIWLYVNQDKGAALRKLCEFGEEHGFVVRIIVYLRRQDEFISSLWRQKVKEGRPLSAYENYGRDRNVRRRCSYYETLKIFEEVVGRENVIVHRFERDKFVGGSILPDFLDIFGVKLTDDYVTDNEVMNLSTNNDYTNIQRILNQLSARPNVIFTQQSKFFADIALRLSEIDGEYSILMDKAGTDAFLEAYEEGNRKIAEEYFGEESNLFTVKEKDLPVWSSDTERFQQAIIKYFGQGLLDQQQRIDEVRENLKENTKRIEHHQKDKDKELKDAQKKIGELEKLLDQQTKRADELEKQQEAIKKELQGEMQKQVLATAEQLRKEMRSQYVHKGPIRKLVSKIRWSIINAWKRLKNK